MLFEADRVSGVGEWRVSIPIGIFRRGDGRWQAKGSRGSGFFLAGWVAPLRGGLWSTFRTHEL